MFGGTSRDIYFRISSVNFNWNFIIYDIVEKYKDQLDNVTICEDSNTFGNGFNILEINKRKINHVETELFLNYINKRQS